MNSKLVSIIVPCYNSQTYLDRCLYSLLNQTYKHIEIILINDGSTDNTFKIIKEYAQHNSKVKMLTINWNLGPSYARNRGMEIANGKFISFVDSDDWLELDAIDTMVNCMNDNIDIVFTDYNKITNTSTCIYQPLPGECILETTKLADLAIDYLKFPNKFLMFSHSWSIMFRRSKLYNIQFNESLHSFEDVDINFRYLQNIKMGYYIPKITYNHQIRSDNYSSTSFSVGSDPSKLFGFFVGLDTLKTFVLKHKDNNDDFKTSYGTGMIKLVIIQLIRTCGQINKKNKAAFILFIDRILKKPEIVNNIRYYKRERGQSIIIPLLIRFRLTRLLVIFCKLRAKQKYG